MNIAHIVFGMRVGGIETMLANIVSEQVFEGHKVGVVIINDLEDGDLIKTIDPRVKIIRIKRPVGSKNPWHILNLNRALVRFNPDVVHLHKAKIYNYLLPRFRRISCVTLHHTLVDDDLKPVTRISYRYAISKAVAQDIMTRVGVNSIIVYNGIRTSEFRYEDNKKCSNGVKKRFVCVGRLVHQIKGQDVLIKAVSLLQPQVRENITLEIVGEGESLQYLQGLVAELGLGDIVKFTGLRSQKWLCDNLCDYDLFIAPSIYEGFGLTIVEAMCAGVPVLVSDIQGPMEVIGEGNYGYYFKCGDSVDCARVIGEVVNGPAGVVADARQYAMDLFDVRQTAKNYLNEYEKIKSLDR